MKLPRALRDTLEDEGIKLPCWPAAAHSTVLLTRGVYKLATWFFVCPLLVFIPLLAFERQVDPMLRLFGYSDEFVSFFPLVRNLQSRLASHRWIKHIDIGYFHLLDAVTWIAIVVWGTWLILGTVFLKQYDDLFQRRSPRMLERFHGRLWLFYLGGIFFASSPFIITSLGTTDKILSDPQVVFYVNKLTTSYFYPFFVTYYYAPAFSSMGLLFLTWKICREKGPGVVLWHQ
jgi:hypothetical protein